MLLIRTVSLAPSSAPLIKIESSSHSTHCVAVEKGKRCLSCHLLCFFLYNKGRFFHLLLLKVLFKSEDKEKKKKKTKGVWGDEKTRVQPEARDQLVNQLVRRRGPSPRVRRRGPSPGDVVLTIAPCSTGADKAALDKQDSDRSCRSWSCVGVDDNPVCGGGEKRREEERRGERRSVINLSHCWLK